MLAAMSVGLRDHRLSVDVNSLQEQVRPPVTCRATLLAFGLLLQRLV